MDKLAKDALIRALKQGKIRYDQVADAVKTLGLKPRKVMDLGSGAEHAAIIRTNPLAHKGLDVAKAVDTKSPFYSKAHYESKLDKTMTMNALFPQSSSRMTGRNVKHPNVTFHEYAAPLKYNTPGKQKQLQESHQKIRDTFNLADFDMRSGHNVIGGKVIDAIDMDTFHTTPAGKLNSKRQRIATLMEKLKEKVKTRGKVTESDQAIYDRMQALNTKVNTRYKNMLTSIGSEKRRPDRVWAEAYGTSS